MKSEKKQKCFMKNCKRKENMKRTKIYLRDIDITKLTVEEKESIEGPIKQKMKLN